MGIFSKLSNALGISREVTLDEFMSASDAEEVDVMHKSASIYVKPIALQADGDIKIVEDELGQKNIALLNTPPVSRTPAKLKGYVDSLKAYTSRINGDLARI